MVHQNFNTKSVYIICPFSTMRTTNQIETVIIDITPKCQFFFLLICSFKNASRKNFETFTQTIPESNAYSLLGKWCETLLQNSNDLKYHMLPRVKITSLGKYFFDCRLRGFSGWSVANYSYMPCKRAWETFQIVIGVVFIGGICTNTSKRN